MPVKRPAATVALSTPTRQDLRKRQKKADGYGPGEARIQTAWDGFRKASARVEVEDRLDTLFHSKCAYCENIVPKDIEHFYPKSRFPKRMFKWNNFLRACKNCNTEKLDTFPFRGNRSPVLLNPCEDEPSKFFTWALDTGLPVLTKDKARYKRAETTVDMFDLKNQQFCDERRARARFFEFCLLQSIEQKPTPPDVHAWLLDELNPSRPFRSVLRQIVRDPAYRKLIAKVKRAVPAAAPLLADLET